MLACYTQPSHTFALVSELTKGSASVSLTEILNPLVQHQTLSG